MAENEKFNQKLDDEQLEGVAGGTRVEFEDICIALGKNPTFNTRDGIRRYLAKHYDIQVLHWNTGDRGSKEDKRAQFVDTTGRWTGTAENNMFSEEVIEIIKNNPVKG